MKKYSLFVLLAIFCNESFPYGPENIDALQELKENGLIVDNAVRWFKITEAGKAAIGGAYMGLDETIKKLEAKNHN